MFKLTNPRVHLHCHIYSVNQAHVNPLYEDYGWYHLSNILRWYHTKLRTSREYPDIWPKSVPFYLPALAAPGCSASPPLPHSCSSFDRSTEAPLPAETETARARHQQAYVPEPPAIRPGTAQAQRQPAWSPGPPGARSQSLLPSP